MEGRGRRTGLVFTELAVGNLPCGITVGGTAYCWLTSPVAGGLRFRTVSAGKLIACGLTTGEVAYCWRTGDSLRADSIVAVKVQGQS